MRASEIIARLQAAVEEHGDLEVHLHGNYGTDGHHFEVASLSDARRLDADHGHGAARGPGLAEIHVITDLGD